MKTRFFALCVLLITTLGVSAFVADDPFAELLKRLTEFTKKYPQEKVHLHLDKPYYAIGDDIWFKAYVTDTRTTALTTVSKILYVELIDEKDSLKQQLKLPLLNGIGWGDFKLPDSLYEGNYRIRAYTQLMRNAGPNFFFDKTIKIGNSWANKVFVKTNYLFSQEGNQEKVNSTIQFTDKTGKPFGNTEVSYIVELSARTITKGKATTNEQGEITIPIVNTQPNIYKTGKITATITLADKQKITKLIPLTTTSVLTDVQFFPESGTLVQNLPSKIAFKAVNANGKGEDIKGVIMDSDGTEITSFESSHLGMGSFFVSPQAGKTYRAKVKFKNGSEKMFNLPKANVSGYVLSVNNADTGKVNLKVLLSDDLIGKGRLNLLVQQNGSIYFSVKIPTGKNVATASLPKSELPSGIITITLFNDENAPVAERLIFQNNKLDKINVGVENLKEGYQKRELMSLNLSSTNTGKPIVGSFSVAVTNTTAIKPDPLNETNILTSLLLTSDLKGYVENPNYYFMDADLNTRLALDHLLLTQGWRKIDWKAVDNSQLPVHNFQAETELKISGTVTTNSGKPVPNGKVSLFSSSAGIFAIDTLTDAKGRFNFNKLEFPDSAKFVIQARNEKGKRDVQITLDIIPGQLITSNKNIGDIEINVNEQLKNYLQNSDDYFNELTKRGVLSKTIQLKKVEIVGQKKLVEHSSNLNGAGRADAIITAKDLENTPQLSMYLSGRIAGVTVRNGQAYLRQSSGPMNIVLDGMSMTGFSLDDINVFDIETIEVLKNIGNTAIYGSQGGNGVLVITTKRGGSSSVSTYSPGIITYSPKGYAISRQFYSPKYDTHPDSRPDLRTTVYWNPNILSDEKGKFKLEYFNTDEPGLYRIVIEGIDLLGNLARETFTYQVN
ncbi:TonB-dependent receptor plug domain-containing protein [Pedobacter insulae]|uniref:TonB-dependent outer membrane receptor, SusC/RagA subfamily, signature region n=1 Tax=Pedobacter insulae TaxID=414048 RepID=A0A1I2T6N3_9SPHI|nr:TonB-dependent receptor plug domain-containing protein [Pedobacter insulae]SFG60654.1 TonB-dependent outer membrane receptor, SusC/RagA subfamily, signature region [Pedobacter insulae]